MIGTITTGTLEKLKAEAASGGRLRAHRNAHPSPDAAVQRLFMAVEPGTYFRPHRHPQAHKWEFMVVLEGRIDLLVFDDAGGLTERIPMSPATTRALEVPANVWHAYVCMEPGTLVLEVKEGAYVAELDKEFAPWSPEEGGDGAAAYLERLRVCG